jgi:hypothetical protein
MRPPLPAAVAACLLLAACSSAPSRPARPPAAPGEPFDEAAWTRARNERIWKVAQECQRRYPSIELVRLTPEGGIHYQYREDVAEERPFEACLEAKRRELLEGAPGRLVRGGAGAAHVTVPFEARDGVLLVTASIEGVPGLFVLDTGAAKSVIKPAVAARAGLTVRRDGLPLRLVVADGRTIAVPLARATVRVGEAAVADLDLGVYDVVPEAPEIDGLLGEDVLGYFTLRIDRVGRRLHLEAAP